MRPFQIMFSFLLCSVCFAQINNAGGIAVSSTSCSISWIDAGADPAGPVTDYLIYLGSSTGSQNYANSGYLGATPTVPYTVTGSFPTSVGSIIYTRLWHKHGTSTWKYNDFYFVVGAPTITSPTPGSAVPTGGFTLTWSAGSFTLFWVYVGTSAGASNILNTGQLPSGSTSVAVPGTYGTGVLYIRLWFKVGSVWRYLQVSYISGTPPTLSFDIPSPLDLMGGTPSVLITATGSPAGGSMTFSVTSNTTGGSLIVTGGTTSGTISFTPHATFFGSATIFCTYTLSGLPASSTYTINVANPLEVTTSADIGAGSLRDVVAYATLVGGGTITFAPALSGSTIALASEIVLSDGIDIEGSGEFETIISGSSSTRIFSIASGATVSLSDMTLRDGKILGTGASGGAINNLGSLSITRCRFVGNLASSTTAEAYGGAIFQTNLTSLTVSECTFQSNIASTTTGYAGGGAVCSTGDNYLDIRNSIFNSNEVYGDTLTCKGGAIFTSNGDGSIIFIDRCSFSTNSISASGTTQGGAIFCEKFDTIPITISSSTFFDNGTISTSDSGYGGAIALFPGTMEINYCTFTLGTSNYGGGIFNAGTLSLKTSTVSGNDTSIYGGGLYNTGSLSVNSSTIVLNTSIVSGASIYNLGTFSLRNTIITPAVSGYSDLLFNLNGGDPNLLLFPLANNGGPTETHLPKPGSPVINAGEADDSIDQRGFDRGVGSADDIGAVEVE